MTTPVQYTGNIKPFFELLITGQQGSWMPNQVRDRTDADATLLIASGVFSKSYGNVPDVNADATDGIVGLTGAQSAALALVARLPSIPSSKTGSVSSAFTGGATTWNPLFGPNALRQAPWGPSGELSNPTPASFYVTAQSPANGPAMFLREGASIRVDCAKVLGNSGAPTYGNLNTSAAGIAAGQLQNTTLAILVYVNRLQGTPAIRLRLGTTSANYIYYQWSSANGELIEGYNMLLVSTAEPIGSGGDSPGGQHSFQTGGAITDGWRYGTGTQTFTFASAIGYMALEMTGLNARHSFWFEGIYYGGKDVPSLLTMGFDIQGVGILQAKTTMDQYGFPGYAAIPTANGNPANPQYLLNAGDVSRMQLLTAAGWDVVQHGVSHTGLGGLADNGAIAAEFSGNRAQLTAMGCPAAASLFTSPNNSYSNRMIAIAAQQGVLWMRHGPNAPVLIPSGLVGLVNPLVQGAYSIALTAAGDAADLARFQALIALLKLYGASAHIYTHGVNASPVTGLETRDTTFAAMMASANIDVAAGLIKFVTPSAFVRDNALPLAQSVLAVPSELQITAGASPFALINTSCVPLLFLVGAGTGVTIDYSRDGAAFYPQANTGQFMVLPGDQLRLTYTVAPPITALRM